MTTQILLEIYEKNRTENLAKLLEDYSEYIDILIDVTNSLSESKVQMPIYKTKIEMLLVKYSLNAKTFLTIVNGTKLNSKHFSKDLRLIDIPSIHIIFRSLYENYLTIFYLFIQEKEDEDIVEYRNLVYEMSSLCKRQTNPVTTSENQKKKELEANVIQKLRSAIIDNSEFQKLDSKIKRRILNSANHQVPSKIFTWTKLFDLCKLNKEVFLSSWNLYSNYAHSEYLSIMQLEDMFKNPTSIKPFIFHGVRAQICLVSHLIIEFSELFSCAKKRFQKQCEKKRTEIILWDKVATGNLYDD